MQNEAAWVIKECEYGENHPVSQPLFVVINTFRIESLNTFETWIYYSKYLHDNMTQWKVKCYEYYTES